VVEACVCAAKTRGAYACVRSARQRAMPARGSARGGSARARVNGAQRRAAARAPRPMVQEVCEGLLTGRINMLVGYEKTKEAHDSSKNHE